MPYVTDTHSLIWHLTEDSKLSVAAKKIFDKVDAAQDYIYIPCIIFYEMTYLIEKKRIDIDFDAFIKKISFSFNYRIEPLCLKIIEKSRTIPKEKISDPWDRLIAATSLHLNFPLISKDEKLKSLGLDIIW